MKRILFFFAAALIMCLTYCEFGSCFDNHRRGFVLGFGAGIGTLGVTGYRGQTDTDIGLQTDLNFGYGINDQLIIHYSGKQFWSLGSEGYSFLTQAHPHFSITYFFKPDGPSFFAGGGVGPGLIFQVGNDYAGVAGKGTAHFTFGREMKRNLLLEFTAIRSFSGHDYVNDSWNFMLLLNWLKY